MEPSLNSNTEYTISEKIIRRSLLPWWIRTFCWIFMIMGIGAIAVTLIGLLGMEAQLSVYGFQTNKPISIIGILIIAILIFKGFAAYSLWFEKDNAINIAKIDAICGIALCIIAMFVMPFVDKQYGVTFRLELILLLFYFRKINRIEYEWENQEYQ